MVFFLENVENDVENLPFRYPIYCWGMPGLKIIVLMFEVIESPRPLEKKLFAFLKL